MNGYHYLNNPLLNKGTAFTDEERKALGITGLLPSAVQTLDEQADQAYAQYSKKTTEMEKYLFLMTIYDTNRTLFYHLVFQHVVEMLPIIYTPTIGDAVMQYSDNFTSPKDAVFVSVDRPEEVRDILTNAATKPEEIEMVVVTDGEGILGIGDWGVNGVNIVVGKSAVYTVAAGINPAHVLSVVIDAGTNNQALLDNPHYLGARHERVTGEKYDAFIEHFVKEVTSVFPKTLLHWEDFGRSNAARILEKYRNEICTFNDDIQGTGIMVVAAALSTTQVSKLPLHEQRIVVFGAGTAGIGVTEQLVHEIVETSDLTEAQARERFYLIDRPGLVQDNLPELTEGQKKFARNHKDFEGQDLSNLLQVVKTVKPTMLIGASGVAGAFTEEVIKEMAQHVERPSIIPLSNPTKLSEAKAQDLLEWTDGKALVVTGSPFAPVEYKGVTYTIGQANNALLYPGLGLGIIVAKAKHVSNNMLSAAARAVGTLMDVSQPGAPMLPKIDRLRETSHAVAVAVVEAAIKEGLSQVEISDVEAAIEAKVWKAAYTTVK